VSLLDLYQQYHDRVQFLMVYIREAHPRDGWWLGGGLVGRLVRIFTPQAATDIYDPRTLAERRRVAGQCEQALQYGIRTYVDDMDDAVSKAYAAKPTRLYLVGLDGRVVYAAGPGPYGFKPDELGSAIADYLALQVSQSE
jgi:hypothetical protein